MHSRIQMVRLTGKSRKVYSECKSSLSHFFSFGSRPSVMTFLFQSEKRLFTKFHRQLFCWIDEWYGLTMADIRRIEDEVQKELSSVWTVFFNRTFVFEIIK